MTAQVAAGISWTRPLPNESVETKPFWEACRRGVFLLQRCRRCRKFQYYYRSRCAHCWTPDPEDSPATGRGKVWTFTVVYRNRAKGFSENLPYVAAVVELEEGVMVVTNIINCDPQRIQIGTPVRLTFVDATDEWRIPVFEPESLP